MDLEAKHCILILQVVLATVGAYDLHYLGCFIDSVGNRDLPDLIYTAVGNSPEMCIAACLNKRYRYSGLQFGKECHCGNAYGKHGKVGDSQCSFGCPGDSRFNCGASSRNSIYRVDDRIQQYMGCYVDKGQRDMPDLETLPTNSPELCMNHCQSKGYAFAAVQYGTHCSCGNTYGKYGKAAETDCSRKCSKNEHLFCGGSWLNAVYRIEPLIDRFKGCYKDNNTRHDLWLHSFALEGSVQTSTGACVAGCASKSLPLAAVGKDLTTCHCGYSYGKYGKADNYRECFCVGGPQSCSSSLRNAVYETGVPFGTLSRTVLYSLKVPNKALPGHVISSEPSVDDVRTCIYFCELVSTCASVNFDASDHVCELNSAIATEGGGLESRGRLTYYAPGMAVAVLSLD